MREQTITEPEIGKPIPADYDTAGEYIEALASWMAAQGLTLESLHDHMQRAAKERPDEYARVVTTLLVSALLDSGLEAGMSRVWSAVYHGHRENALQWLDTLHAWYRALAAKAGAPHCGSLAHAAQDLSLLRERQRVLFLDAALPIPMGLPN